MGLCIRSFGGRCLFALPSSLLSPQFFDFRWDSLVGGEWWWVGWNRYEAIAYYLSGYWAVLLDIPLFESALDRICGAALVVSVSSSKLQIYQLLARDTPLVRRREDADADSRGGGVVSDGVRRTRTWGGY